MFEKGRGKRLQQAARMPCLHGQTRCLLQTFAERSETQKHEVFMRFCPNDSGEARRGNAKRLLVFYLKRNGE